jgi:hypothetical protein
LARKAAKKEVRMSDKSSVPAQLRTNADLAVSTIGQHCGVALTFDQAGVEWIDGYINRSREDLIADQDNLLAAVNVLAAFVGECIIRTYGGTWVEKEGEWCVQVNEAIWACPFAKVTKQFNHGPKESVAGYFTLIPSLMSLPGLDVPGVAPDHSPPSREDRPE